MKPAYVSMLAAALARGALDLDGSRIVHPLSKGDASPIADPLTYIPAQHDCPLPCRVDYTNVHKWTPYYTVDRLQRCGLPMLLDFSVLHPLDDPNTDVLIRSCTLADDPASTGDRTVANATSVPIDNPKFEARVLESSLELAPACAIGGREKSSQLVLTTSTGRSSSREALQLLSGIEKFFSFEDNCDETFLFAHYNQTVAAVHIGAGLGKRTVASVVRAVTGRLSVRDSVGRQTVAQVCGAGGNAATVFGLAIDTTGDIVRVQTLAAAWSRGSCADGEVIGAHTSQETLAVKVFDIASAPLTDSNGNSINITANSGNATASQAPGRVRQRGGRRLSTAPRSPRVLGKRATCSYIRVESGDGCASLAAKCGIRGADFVKYNPQSDLCSTLQPGDYVCCSAGDPYTEPKPPAPKPNPDGSCAAHLIQNGDTCDELGKRHGLNATQIESFNKGKTWGWTGCGNILAGYYLCLSTGSPPLPPPQQGTECGPLVPGTTWTNASIPMADLNPCPLKACCSNWGFCGPFSAHCDIHAPPGGAPGSKLPGFNSTCVSSCGNDIKQNSGPPAAFSRIGYYESWNMGRKCLWLKAQNANPTWAYTHLHWGFAEIDPADWTVVIKDPHKQWQAFKNLPNVKRIVSFGGWAYSTEPATYNIIRQAIITNREKFATNAAKFVMDEGLDGIDIDWEYPGAPDIMVDGKPIGQPGDGVAYLRFLTTLKSKLPSKSVSIAAPASYWYLKAFPIDRIAAVIDYIVYMTYDLHGQWDYGNVNAFDVCPSGKCIRSHVNLTETRNALSIITKAGVPNNKIFVGEASYGRSFHMAVDGCWGPMCDFTGSRLQSHAAPGRCTNTSGYIAYAEIMELIRQGGGQVFHDDGSNTDVLLYNGDYISYMMPLTKETRRADWKKLNFAGSVDWAVDLQAFGPDDFDSPITTPQAGEEACVSGESGDLNADELCQFACHYGYCPEPKCYCLLTGPAPRLPAVASNQDFVALDELDVELQRLCKFACKYGFCPPDTCSPLVVDEWDDGSVDPAELGGMMDRDKYREADKQECLLFKDPKNKPQNLCYAACREAVEAAKAEGRTTNYGCVGHFPLDQEIPWAPYGGDADMLFVKGKCVCDHMLVNILADTIIDALPIIAQIGCYVVMSALKLVLDIGLEAIPGVGKILDAGLDAVTTAAQIISYAYPADQNPIGAFEWWLSPCGGSDLVPEEIKRVFDILSAVADGVSSFKEPPNIRKGSGKKGDPANPTDRSKPKAGTGTGPNGTGSGGVKKRRKCKVGTSQSTVILGAPRNTLRLQSCVTDGNGASTTTKTDRVITSLAFGPRPTTVEATCSRAWTQACHHYSSAIVQNPAWGAIRCPHGSVSNPEANSRPGVRKFYSDRHRSWLDSSLRAEPLCDVDEYPPRYLLLNSSPEMRNAGQPGGQLMRYLPNGENQAAGKMWKGACFTNVIKGWTPAEFRRKWDAVPAGNVRSVPAAAVNVLKAEVPVDVTPHFRIAKWEHTPLPDDGMRDNKCWPAKAASQDPGFTVWSWDNWYRSHPPGKTYDYSKPYQKGTNGD